MRCPNLNELPRSPPDKSGWPWTEEGPRLPETMPDGSPWLRFSIITPSYNQGEFIEETIRSVLLQGYPNLEYMIIDGGSTDGSVEIIKKYERWLAYWVSEKDRGQSHAINKGWEAASGEIVTYLCSDDIYFPNALMTVAASFRSNPDVGILTGGIASADESSNLQAVEFPRLPATSPTDLTLLDPDSWFLPQASSFIVGKTLSEIGAWVREDLHYTMDRELLYRAVRIAKVLVIDQPLATYRHHQKSKTTARQIAAYNEASRAFSYCQWGDEEQQKVRLLILQRRMAQGYYRFGKSTSGTTALIYLLRAAWLRPSYLFSRSYIKSFIKKLAIGRIL